MMPLFASMMAVINDHHNKLQTSQTTDDIHSAYHQYGSARRAKKSPSKERKAAGKYLAFCLISLVKSKPRQAAKSCLELQQIQYWAGRYEENILGPSPAVGLNEEIFIPRSSNGEAFAHDGDKDVAERYNRVFQLMLMLWKTVSRRSTNDGLEFLRGEDSDTFQNQWERFWQQKHPFGTRDDEFDFEERLPLWMRTA